MPKNLVIVESPTKIKSISKYLGGDYIVIGSKGHIIDLPKSQIGIDTENNYKPDYVTVRGRTTVIKELKKAAKKAKTIYLATDLDREGEAIAWHIVSALEGLNPKGKVSDEKKFKRVVFAEITKDAIKEAFKNPRGFDYGLIDAYQARRVLDRLVGYKLSPLLWKKIMYGLSAGRVQSIAVRLIVERETERASFESNKYYRISTELSKNKEFFLAELSHINKEKVDQQHKIELFANTYSYGSTTITPENANSFKEDLATIKTLKVDELTERGATKKPSPPLATAAMQRAAQTTYGFSAKQTMMLAQRLYEEGLITYHRTDSTNLSKQFIENARAYIKKTYGAEYLPNKANIYKTKKQGAQEAHEAIRPTQVSGLETQLPAIEGKLGSKEARLYNIIWKRAIASQASNAEYKYSNITLVPTIKTKNGYTFTSKGTRITFDGFRRITNDSNGEKILPKLSKGEELPIKSINLNEHQTSPPPRYTEASLIKDLEANGIGRPSTYAPIIDTIQARDYVVKENGSLIPEDTGIVVNKLLMDRFPEIVDLQFTAKMETNFDQIAAGELKWIDEIDRFYKPFEKKLESAEEDLSRDDYKILEHLDEKCPDCNHHLIMKLGKYGKFYSCSDFPECKYARPYVDYIGMPCFKCKDGQIILRRTRFGKKFFGCSNYPDCNWASWKDPRDPNYDDHEEQAKRAAREKRKAEKEASEKKSKKKTKKSSKKPRTGKSKKKSPTKTQA